MSRRPILLLLVVALAVGCAYVPSTRLQYDAPRVADRAPARLDVAVLPLREERPPRHWPSYTGRLFLTYVPLLPWIKIPYERLDESYLKSRDVEGERKAHGEHFTRKFSEVMAEDLRRSGLFESVRFVGEGDPGAEVDLVLSGALRSTEFDAYASSYMLGMPGVLLWLLPIPVGRNAATVELDLELRRPGGTVVWSDQVQGRSGQLFFLYSPSASVAGEFGLDVYRFRGDEHGIDEDSLWAYHADALRKAMEEARGSLRESLPRGVGTAERAPGLDR